MMAGIYFLGPGRFCRKVQFNPLPCQPGGEEAAEGIELDDLPSLCQALAEEDMGAGQSGVAAEVNLHLRGKPAQAPAILPGCQEGRLRQVHLHGHLLHPCLSLPAIEEQAHSRRVAGEGLLGKGVHLVYGISHHSSLPSLSMPLTTASSRQEDMYSQSSCEPSAMGALRSST